TTALARPASGNVSAPRPDPISINVSSPCGSIARMTLSTHAGSRKCWPKRFLAWCVVVFATLAPPVPLLDSFDLFLAQSEIVADLVDQGFGDGRHQVVFVRGLALVRALKQQDAIGQGIAESPRALGQRC